MQTFTVQSRFGANTFESPYDNGQATTKFLQFVQLGKIDSDFAKSIARGIQQYRRATDRQLPWVHRMVLDAEQRDRKIASVPAVPTTGGFQSIVDHMANCRRNRDEGGKGLLYPAICLTVDGQPIVLKLQGEKSKNAGGVSVTSERRFGTGEYFGCITKDGVLKHSRLMTPKVIEILERIAVEPRRVISELGRESGCCCYCKTPLTTVQSKIAGCGDTCADKWQVWYPNAEETREYLVEHPGVLEGASDADRWN